MVCGCRGVKNVVRLSVSDEKIFGLKGLFLWKKVCCSQKKIYLCATLRQDHG